MDDRSGRGLVEAIEAATGSDGEFPTAIGPLCLYRKSGVTESIPTVYEPSFCVIAQGAKRVMLADQVFDYDPGHYLLASVGLPVAGRVVRATPERPYLSLCLNLDPGVIGELLADAGPEAGPPPSGPESSPLGLAVSPLDPGLLDAVTRLVRLLDAPRDLRALAPLVLREIGHRLLTGDQGPRLRRIVLGSGNARRIGDAIAWLRQHFAEPCSIDALARTARMSPSGLHHHFKAVTAMSPLQFQKHLRLQEARRLMLARALDAASAAYHVGYESPSQFSREYSRLFGAPPGRDLARLREAARPPA